MGCLVAGALAGDLYRTGYYGNGPALNAAAAPAVGLGAGLASGANGVSGVGNVASNGAAAAKAKVSLWASSRTFMFFFFNQ